MQKFTYKSFYRYAFPSDIDLSTTSRCHTAEPAHRPSIAIIWHMGDDDWNVNTRLYAFAIGCRSAVLTRRVVLRKALILSVCSPRRNSASRLRDAKALDDAPPVGLRSADAPVSYYTVILVELRLVRVTL